MRQKPLQTCANMLDFRVLTANRKTNVIFRQASVSIIDEYFDFLNEEQKRYQHAARWRNAGQLNTENLAAMLAETRPEERGDLR